MGDDRGRRELFFHHAVGTGVSDRLRRRTLQVYGLRAGRIVTDSTDLRVGDLDGSMDLAVIAMV